MRNLCVLCYFILFGSINFSFTGMSYSVGSLTRKGYLAPSDGETVSNIKAFGGIPLLVSNTPEFCTSWESINKITGRTKNPYDTRRTAGGSSGGEVSLKLIAIGLWPKLIFAISFFYTV